MQTSGNQASATTAPRGPSSSGTPSLFRTPGFGDCRSSCLQDRSRSESGRRALRQDR
jgi:hypothetical protein